MTYEEWHRKTFGDEHYRDDLKEAWLDGRPQWQPIETAPKHEPILTLTKHGVIEGEWDGEFVLGYYGRDMQWYASYWMPLPEPPTDTHKKE